jgi:hypothetical protein
MDLELLRRVVREELERMVQEHQGPRRSEVDEEFEAAATKGQRPERLGGAYAFGRWDWTKVQKTCPRCKCRGAVDPDFGIRQTRGVPGPQSWCRKCRSTTDYHPRARKYKKRGPIV